MLIILSSIANESVDVYGKLIPSSKIAKKQTIEEIVISKFKPYYGKSVPEISHLTEIPLNIKSLNFYSRITNAVLNIELHKHIEEFEKANIEVKTIRVESNNNIVQSVSFPSFEFTKIFNENWINSEMKDIAERKFLFIFFKKQNQDYHVRPHGADSTYTFPLPVMDKSLKTNKYSKQCFWLKNTYVRDAIYLNH